jgi:hypothetical protein
MSDPFIYTPASDISFDVGDDHFELRAGEEFEIPYSEDEYCQIRDFVVKANEASGNALDDGGILAALQTLCEEGGTPSNEVNSPPEPPTETDPSSTGTDIPPPWGVETSETLNAPPPPENADEITTSSPPPTTPYPISDYELVDDLFVRGVPPEDFEDALERVRRNEPLPGLPHWHFGLDNQEPPSQAVDPVDVFAGCYMLTVTDVQIPSRGFPLQLTRFYRSGPAYYDPWGYNWDHNYNVYLRELKDGGAAIWTGHLSEDVYRPNSDGGFDPPTGIFREPIPLIRFCAVSQNFWHGRLMVSIIVG